MVPTDGLCHHVYYTNLMVIESVLTPVKISLSWNMFKAAVKAFRKTVGGVGFDVRYVDEVDLQAEVREQLYKLNPHNVRHYGILNVLETSSKLKDLFNKARRLLTILKRFQEARDVYGKTILAFGIYNYLGPRAWETLQEVFTSAVENSVADTVIAYSSVGWIEEPSECFSHPPSIFNKSKYIAGARKQAGRAPDIFTVSRLMTADKRFKTAVKVGLSFELGTLIYEVKEKAINFDMVNAPCKSLYVASLDAVPCRNDPYSMRGELFQGVNVAELRDFRKTIILFEDDITIAQKCRQLALRSTNLRFGMALLLVNAHLGDFSVNSTCAAYGEKDREDPFWRIKVIRTELNIP
ncbi:uncharacterized protein LOC142774405 [Rhipicephalus microplus]|uniref:uncharacterized protein LOC142774405 n=1 Tax=Rhipicephalus microplus TaxID=6941 RepID=UPI003F6BB69E